MISCHDVTSRCSSARKNQEARDSGEESSGHLLPFSGEDGLVYSLTELLCLGRFPFFPLHFSSDLPELTPQAFTLLAYSHSLHLPLPAGYVGSHLVKQLLERGYTVNATVRDASDEAKYGWIKSLVSR